MRIAVTTPMGHVGHHLTFMLIRAGVRPLLLARNPEKVPEALREHADVAEADSTNLEQVAAATRGVDAIYWVDPSAASENPLADYAQATRAIAHAVTANGIRRVVFQSSVGAEKRSGVGEIDGLAGTEVALDGLGVDVTHLRNGYFFTNLLLDIESVREGHLQTVMPLGRPMAWVAPRDIAEVAALTLLNGTWRGRRVQAVHGPADLSWNDVAALLTDHLGREVSVDQVSDDAMRDQYLAAGMPPKMADAVLGMSTGIRDDFEPEQPRSITSTTPTTLASWIRDALVPSL